MKRITLVLLMAVPFALSAQRELAIDTKITHVTVFLDKAQVTREGKTRLDAGKTSLVLAGVTAQLDPQSIQVNGSGNFIILGVQHRQNYLNEFNMPKRLKMLRDSLDYFQSLLTLEQNLKEILNKEEQMILANQKVGSTQQNITAADLKSMADFFRTRLSEIGMSRLKSDEKIKKFNERISRLNRQINEETNTYQRNTSEIVVNVSADVPTAAALSVDYVVANAGWAPVYDIRATDTQHPVKLAYKANVYQTTGEEWRDVHLVLSTANPNLGGFKPELDPWYVDVQQPVIYRQEAAGAARAMPSAADKVGEESFAAATTSADYVRTIQTTLNTQFDIDLPYTVTSQGKPTLVDIRNLEVHADYTYITTPKLDQDAFLTARTTGWEELSLLPGQASVFFEGTFVSNSFIDPASTRDTLAISLGRDKRIVVSRQKIKDFTSRRVIGTNQREDYAWEISVRNTKQQAVTISVEDQVPVSRNSQIEVTVADTGGAKYNRVTGKLVWDLTLQPNETKMVSFRYEVKYPKDMRVQGL